MCCYYLPAPVYLYSGLVFRIKYSVKILPLVIIYFHVVNVLINILLLFFSMRTIYD